MTTEPNSTESPGAESTGGAGLQIRLEGFEGPLDLLLHLINKHKLDILDIPIAFITEEYLGYLEAMESLDLGVSGEYLVMAATLLHMKSRTLLPRPEEPDDEDGDGAEWVDPREELVRRLLTYQRFRDAAETLAERAGESQEQFRRPSRAGEYRSEAGPPDLLPVGVFHLVDTFRRLMTEHAPEAVHEITPESLSLRDTINTLAGHLQHTPRATLTELIGLVSERRSRGVLVVTFLALLEMAKLRLIKLFQSRLVVDDLIVERAVVSAAEIEQQLQGLSLEEEDDNDPA